MPDRKLPTAPVSPFLKPFVNPRDRVIPTYTFKPPVDTTGRASPGYMNDVAQTQRQSQIMGPGRDSCVPIIYGGWERTAGLLYTATVSGTYLVLAIILCEGPVESISSVEMNDSALPTGVTVTTYDGTQTTPDPTLAGNIAGFSETLAGVAYMVCVVPPNASPGFPRFTALVKGRKVYDPRDGTQTQGTASTYKWSDNPALILADFLADTSYGARKTVDWSSVTTVANYCDALIGSPAEKRALLTFQIAEKRPVAEWIEAIRAYVPCWVLDDGATVSLVADTTRSSDHTFTAANIAANPTPKLIKRGVLDVPTAVEIGYTRTDVTPWVTAYAEADSGVTPRRKTRVDMPGIRRYSQARRFAIERLNHYRLEDLEIELGVFEDGLKVREGDVMTVTDDVGITAKTFRVLGAQDRGFGRWTLKGREYSGSAYSTAVESAPGGNDTNLPDPRIVAAPTGLTINETVFLESNIANDSLGRGLIYQSRLSISWTAAAYAYPCVYVVRILQAGTIIDEGTTTGTSYASPAVQQGVSYTVNVITRSGLGFESSPVSGTKLAQGKLLPPGDVPAIVSALEIGGEVLLQWSPAADIDVVRYEWRYGAVSGFTWDGATLVDRIDGLRARFRGLPVGTWRFAVKAIDSVGNYSANATTADVTITSDVEAFLQTQTISSSTLTLTNMLEMPRLEAPAFYLRGRRSWVTNVSGDTWNSKLPNPVNSGTTGSVFSYHSSATSKVVGAAWDLGQTITGDWYFTTPITYGDAPTLEIETSTDNVTYTARSGTTWKGAARYVRPVVRTATTSTLILYEPLEMALSAQSRTESGTATSLSSGAKTITLSNKYSKAIRVELTPIGTSSKTATVDNVVLSTSGTNSFDVYVFDSTGAQVASDFYWTFEGV